MKIAMNAFRTAVAAASALAITAGMAQAEEFKLRWGHYLPNSGFVQVEKDFAAAIEERTNGRVKIEIIFAGGLGKGPEVALLAGRGAIDMASVAPGYYPDQLLFWKAYQIPFVFDEPQQAISILRRSYKEFPVFKQETDKINVNYLFHQPLGAYYLTGPSPDCTTVEALKGKKIRSFGADVPKMHNAIGAVPVTVQPTEVYEALQRGTIDYSFLNAGNIESLRLYEPGKYNCGPVMVITGHLIVIGKRTWDKLPADSIAKIEEGGGEFKEFPAAELAKWKAATPDLLAEWAESLKSRGMGDQAKEVESAWREWTK